jgi:hypothetical protein
VEMPQEPVAEYRVANRPNGRHETDHGRASAIREGRGSAGHSADLSGLSGVSV